MVLVLIVGFLLGFFGSIPVAGPTSVLVLKNAFEKGEGAGVDIAVGAGVGESIYALLAFWGFTAALVQFPKLADVARVAGGVLVIGVGIYLVARRTGPGDRRNGAAVEDKPGRRWLRGFASAFFNPTLIATWTTVVTALHGASLISMRPLNAVPFALGVGTGIVVWFVVLLKLIHPLRSRMRPESIDRAMRIMGWALIGIGIAITGRAVLKLQVS